MSQRRHGPRCLGVTYEHVRKNGSGRDGADACDLHVVEYWTGEWYLETSPIFHLAGLEYYPIHREPAYSFACHMYHMCSTKSFRPFHAFTSRRHDIFWPNEPHTERSFVLSCFLIRSVDLSDSLYFSGNGEPYDHDDCILLSRTNVPHHQSTLCILGIGSMFP